MKYTEEEIIDMIEQVHDAYSRVRELFKPSEIQVDTSLIEYIEQHREELIKYISTLDIETSDTKKFRVFAVIITKHKIRNDAIQSKVEKGDGGDKGDYKEV